MEGIPYIGETLALLSPLAWSVAVILYRKSGEVVPPMALNLFKNLLATPLVVLSAWALGSTAPEGVLLQHYLLLALSGVIGICVADLCFFLCLNRIGAGRQAIVNTAYSPSIIFLSAIFLGERLSFLQMVGVLLILSAVVAVGWGGERIRDIPRATLAVGIAFGLGACFTQAVSIVIVKPFMDDWPLLWMTAWRMVGGLVATIAILPLMRTPRQTLAPLLDRRTWKVVIPGSFIGTYVSLLLWMGGFKYTSASVASALNQTATLFTFLLAVLILHEPVTRRRLAGLALGFGGVLLVALLR